MSTFNLSKTLFPTYLQFLHAYVQDLVKWAEVVDLYKKGFET